MSESVHDTFANQALPLSNARLVPPILVTAPPYQLRIAQASNDLERLCRLRFEVFNLELGEGLSQSFHSGTDVDQFDSQCHHLLVEHQSDGVVGTYRLQTAEIASPGLGFYSAQEFGIEALQTMILGDAVELGRACIAKAHRNKNVLFLLWKGLAKYATFFDKRYFFGCNSLTTQDPVQAWQTFDWLQRNHHLWSGELVLPNLAHLCPRPEPHQAMTDRKLFQSRLGRVPRLFAAYLRYGSKVCSHPAIDREFGTMDFLTLMDFSKLPSAMLARFQG